MNGPSYTAATPQTFSYDSQGLDVESECGSARFFVGGGG